MDDSPAGTIIPWQTLRRASACAIAAFTWSICAIAIGQVMGEEAEMERLQLRADEAIANEDADTAAMNAGKAALMAATLARRHEDDPEGQLFRGAEALFRGQEHTYRAVALFERAGGKPPASTGACGSLQLAARHTHKSITLLAPENLDCMNPERLQQAEQFEAAAADWVATVDALIADYQCP